MLRLALIGVVVCGGWRQDSLDALERRVRSERPEARAAAVRALGRQGSSEAFELIWNALSDREAQVADAAQLALGGLQDPRLLAELLGRRGLGAKGGSERERDRRLRIAELLGRVAGPVDGEVLARFLRAKDVELSRRLCWSLERLARRDALVGERAGMARRLEACLGRHVDPGLRASALFTLAVLAPDRARAPVREGLTDREGEVRCAALAALEFGDPASGARAARGALADGSPFVRTFAARLVARHPDRAGLEALVARLDREPRERLAAELVATLQRLTGRRHRRDPRPWRAWLETLEPGWRPGAEAPAPDEPATATATTRLPLGSDRVAFLVDLSGSVWNVREDGTTAKQSIDVTIRRTLEALPRAACFNVVPYTKEPRPWEDALVEASPRAVSRAWTQFERLHMSGPGDYYGAALAALTDPAVDTLCALTDGAPTGGSRWDLDLIVPLLLERTRWRPVRFDVALVDCPRRLRTRWQSLVAASGGELVELELSAAEPGR